MSARPSVALLAAVFLVSGCRSSASAIEYSPSAATAAMPGAGATKSVPPALLGPDRVLPPAAGSVAELGALAPEFELTDLAGRVHRLSQYRGKIVVLEWFDPECPFVAYAYDNGPLAEMQTRYTASGVVWLSIQSANADHVATAGTLGREFAARHRLRAPILVDRDGALARRFGARTTPHLFVVNGRGALVYSGALDNAPMGRVERASAKTNYVDAAIADLRSGHAVTTSSTRPYGSALAYARP